MLIFVQVPPESIIYVLLSTKLHIPKMYFKNRKIPYRIFQASVVLVSVAIFRVRTPLLSGGGGASTKILLAPR